MEENINIQQALFFSFLEKPSLKTKKIIDVSYLIMVLIKMRLIIFLTLSRYGLACKHGIIIQMSIYDWMQD